tara:strand:- start:3430 stop:3768 length:339 start_codon:yes stop_codon:yes gene_type:complete
MNEEPYNYVVIKEKLEKLEAYENAENTRKRWQPYKEMKRELSEMYDCKETLSDAASYQERADEISSEFGLHLTTHGSADIWDAHAELEKQIEAKELELKELEISLDSMEEEK